MPELNEPQERAVAHVDGPLLIFAGAGSGKTRTITYRVANLVATHRVAPYRILAVTFTNKAAAEMRGRLVALVGEEVAKDLWIGTFHAVCARLLRRYSDDVGLTRHFSIYDDSDQKAVMTRVFKRLDVDEERFPVRQALSMLHAEKREGRTVAELRAHRKYPGLITEVFEAYEQALAAADAADFEDLILKAMRFVEDRNNPNAADLRRRFQHVLVDEFQDTNLTQYRFVRALCETTRNLCVVGDDDQSIYRWRGADVRIIRGFKSDFPDTAVVKLEQNYRSTKNIVAAALGVIEPAHTREDKKLWTEADDGDKVIVRAVDDERAEALHVVGGIRGELARGTPASSIAVFYRVNAQSRVLEEALRSQNIAYQVIGGMKFFERAEVKDLLAYLRLIDNPKSDADLYRVINTPTRGIGNKTIEAIQQLAAERALSGYQALEVAAGDPSLGTAARKSLVAFHSMIEELRDEALKLGPAPLADHVLELSGYRSALQKEDNPEADARLENLAELVGSIAEYAEQTERAGETPMLSGYLEGVSLTSDIDTMKDVALVSLMTVHGAKGLEFDAVFLTGMEEEVFPYRGMESGQIEELDEERRLAYVAITRARKRLVITYTGQRTLFGRTRYLEPSRFLKDLPERVIARQGRPTAHRYGATAQGYAGRLAFGQSWSNSERRSPATANVGERFVDSDAFDDLPSDESGRILRPGDRVSHKKFGEGVVERIEPGTTPTVVAMFGDGWGRRRVQVTFLEFDQ